MLISLQHEHYHLDALEHCMAHLQATSVQQGRCSGDSAACATAAAAAAAAAAADAAAAAAPQSSNAAATAASCPPPGSTSCGASPREADPPTDPLQLTVPVLQDPAGNSTLPHFGLDTGALSIIGVSFDMLSCIAPPDPVCRTGSDN